MPSYGPYSEIESATTEAALIAGASPEVYRLFLLQPEVVFQAQVAQSTFVYPMSEVAYDGVTTGAFGDVEVGQTIFFGSSAGAFDLGATRVRAAADASKIYFGRSSRGVRPGEVNLSDDVYISIYDLREIWGRPPFIDSGGAVQKDPGLAVEWRTTTPPPVANTGPGFCRTIDPDTSVITVALPPTANTSVATADGASISTYLWDVKDGTVVSGTVNDSTLVATFPAGFRYVSLTVTDDEGHFHTAYCPIFARDPDDDPCIPFQFERHTIRPDGQDVAIRILADIPADEYPPGTLAMIWRGEPDDLFDRSHMVIIGWLGDIPAQIQAQRTGTLRDTTLEILDVAGRLKRTNAYTQRVEDESLRDTDAFPAITWFHIVDLNMDKYLHYLLAWHTTALSLADFVWSGTGDTYAATGLESGGGDLWEQLASQAAKLKPDYALTCNRRGQLRVLPDPMLQDSGDRTATIQATLDASDWSDLRYEHRRNPRVFWLRSGAIRAGRTLPLSTVFSLAPGDAPGQGGEERTANEGLVASQTILNASEGHRYARINAPQSEFRVSFADGDDRDIEPADMTWVELTLPAALAAQRGLSFTESRGLPKELSIRYSHAREGLTRAIEMTWERETVGLPAVTYIPPASDLDDDDTTWPGDFHGSPPPPPPPDDPEEGFFFDPVQAYLMWDGARIYYTPDILAGGGPVWEFADDDVTGDLYDCQYVVNSGTTVGIWLMASTGIWFCDDIFTSPRNWVNVLPIATIQAADATPASGSVVCQAMANYASEPGYLCVATGPDATSDTANDEYAETNFWHTHDYGDNWTRVDAGLTHTSSSKTRGYCRASVHSMEIFRSAPGTIYCVRSTPNVSLNYRVGILKSSDLGDTWEIAAYVPQNGLNNRASYSLLHPFPSATDASYVVSGTIGTSNQPDLQRSADEWAAGVQLTDDGTPTGYGGMPSVWRVNKISDDGDHVLGWFRHSATGDWHLLESNDQGVTWSLLYDSGEGEVGVPNLPIAITVNSPWYSTPNGWPGDADGDTWFLVRANGTGGAEDDTAGAILMTQDRFATAPTDMAGNLNTLLSGDNWTSGPNGGIALPRIGPNA